MLETLMGQNRQNHMPNTNTGYLPRHPPFIMHSLDLWGYPYPSPSEVAWLWLTPTPAVFYLAKTTWWDAGMVADFNGQLVELRNSFVKYTFEC